MSRKEAETIGIVREEHCAEIAVAQTYFTVFGNRTGNTERLKTYADFFSRLGSLFRAALYSDSRAYGVRPDCVFKADRLNASYYSVNVNAFVKSNFFALFNIFNAVFGETLIDLIDSSFVYFKSNSHN